MADITISLSDDRKLSIKNIGVSQFLAIWDDLMASKVVSGLVDDKEERECQHRLSGTEIKMYARSGVFNLCFYDDIEDGALRRITHERLNPYKGQAKEIFDKVANNLIGDNCQYRPEIATLKAARIATEFMWERMKDNYIIGLEKSNANVKEIPF